MAAVTRVPSLELELSLQRAAPPARDGDATARPPFVVARMPAYSAAALAHRLVRWEAIRAQARDGPVPTDWLGAAVALMTAARAAAGEHDYPELDDLPAIGPSPAPETGRAAGFTVVVDRLRPVRVDDPPDEYQPAVVARLPLPVAVALAHVFERRASVARLLADPADPVSQFEPDTWENIVWALLQVVGEAYAQPCAGRCGRGGLFTRPAPARRTGTGDA